jgi:hypothetical protein
MMNIVIGTNADGAKGPPCQLHASVIVHVVQGLGAK